MSTEEYNEVYAHLKELRDEARLEAQLAADPNFQLLKLGQVHGILDAVAYLQAHQGAPANGMVRQRN